MFAWLLLALSDPNTAWQVAGAHHKKALGNLAGMESSTHSHHHALQLLAGFPSHPVRLQQVQMQDKGGRKQFDAEFEEAMSQLAGIGVVGETGKAKPDKSAKPTDIDIDDIDDDFFMGPISIEDDLLSEVEDMKPEEFFKMTAEETDNFAEYLETFSDDDAEDVIDDEDEIDSVTAGGSTDGKPNTRGFDQVMISEESTKSTQKYVLIRCEPQGERHFYLVRGDPSVEYHNQVAQPTVDALRLLKLPSAVEGGGRISHDPEKKEILVYGYSYGYPWKDDTPRHDITVGLLEKMYPDYKIDWTNEGY